MNNDYILDLVFNADEFSDKVLEDLVEHKPRDYKIKDPFDEFLKNNKRRKRKPINDLMNPFKNLDLNLNNYNVFGNAHVPIKKKDESNTTSAPIYYVDSSELPHGPGWRALGMYVPSSHTIYIANNLSTRASEFVKHHEIAHSYGIRDEGMADAYAAAQTGYYLSA